MKFSRISWILGCILMSATFLHAQTSQGGPHIGYVYPAGGKQDSSFDVTIGGQFLGGLTNIFVSGGGVQSSIVEVIRPISGKELNDLRIKADELLARRSVVKNDFKALENFRSFKNASKDDKKNDGMEDKEIQDLKKKYENSKWTAEDDKMLMDVRKKISGGIRRPENPSISEIASLRFKISPDAKPGDREIRLVTAQGLTNPMLFKIGVIPEYTEPAKKTIQQQRVIKGGEGGGFGSVKEKKDTKVTLPAVINGQILEGTIDRYCFEAKKGTKLVIISSARELIPYIADAVPGWFQATLALYDSSGNEVAYNDDFQSNPDPVLYYEIPSDGEYVLAIKDSIYRGREDFVYRITLGELPFITSIFPLGGPKDSSTKIELKGWNLPSSSMTFDVKDKAPGIYPVSLQKDEWISNVMPFAVDDVPDCLEKEPDSQHRTAQMITMPVVVNGSIDHPDDRDFFKFEGKAGDEIVAEVYARRLNSPLDAMVKLSDAGGREIGCNDDFEDKGSGLETHHADSYLRVTLPSNGTYFVEVVDVQHNGGPEYAYRLRVSMPRPDFALRVTPSSVNLRAGGTVAVTIYALRYDGFTNAINVALKDAPEGFKLGGTIIPGTQEQVRVTLTAPPLAQTQPVALKVEGTATIKGNVVTRQAVPSEDMMQAFFYRHLVPSEEMRVGVGGRAKVPAVKVISALPVRIPAGGTAVIKLNIPGDLAAKKIDLELDDPPAGVRLVKFSSMPSGAEILLASDQKQVKEGQEGNLIIAAYLRSDKTEKDKQSGKSRVKLTTLPAIPFEVIAKQK